VVGNGAFFYLTVADLLIRLHLGKNSEGEKIFPREAFNPLNNCAGSASINQNSARSLKSASSPFSGRRMGITRRDAASAFADLSAERRRRGTKSSFPETGFSKFNPLKIKDKNELKIPAISGSRLKCIEEGFYWKFAALKKFTALFSCHDHNCYYFNQCNEELVQKTSAL
jgi:hypothetical protein